MRSVVAEAREPVSAQSRSGGDLAYHEGAVQRDLGGPAPRDAAHRHAHHLLARQRRALGRVGECDGDGERRGWQEHEQPERQAETHSGHHHRLDTDRRALTVALAIVAAVMGAEIAAGLVAHSLALLADAGHMVTDAGALTFAVLAARMAARSGGSAHGARPATVTLRTQPGGCG